MPVAKTASVVSTREIKTCVGKRELTKMMSDGYVNKIDG